MGYRTLKACVDDLHRHGHLLIYDRPVDPNLEVAEIHRRVFQSGGPAILFSNVIGCRFPLVSNVFGSMARVEFIFRDTWDRVRRLVELKAAPERLAREWRRYWQVPWTITKMVPRRVWRAPVLAEQTSISQLPHIRCWPRDGGAFVLLPLVYTEDVARPGWPHSNLGMYRIQLSGGQYTADQQIGLHYQLHRGIGIHHASALKHRAPFRVNIFVGGTPAMTVAAVMPLPEGLSELTFAGALAGHRIPLYRPPNQLPVYAEADFCITGMVEPDLLLPEGPFGDHLGYYSLAHDFPVLRVERVSHRRGAIWPFTVVGRPPQEDTYFGRIVHELTGPVIPRVVPGVHAVHAVDAAGVHPLMLAIGSERYTPYDNAYRPKEILTQANAILGQGQMSLAKYLLIVARDDDPHLDIHDIGAFFQHLLRRIDWARDLHFQTETTIDTLDYSGPSLHAGSKVVMAAAGPTQRILPTAVDADLRLPPGYHDPRVCLPGILAIQAPACAPACDPHESAASFCACFDEHANINQFPLVLLVDDSPFVASSLNNFLWVTFTRSDPARDIHGICTFVQYKHWGCRGSMVIDARIKPHHAMPLEPDPEVSSRVDAIAAGGGPLSCYL